MPQRSLVEKRIAKAMARLRTEWVDETQNEFVDRLNGFLASQADEKRKYTQSHVSKIESKKDASSRVVDLDYFHSVARSLGVRWWQLVYLIELQETTDHANSIEERQSMLLEKCLELGTTRLIVEQNLHLPPGLMFRSLVKLLASTGFNDVDLQVTSENGEEAKDERQLIFEFSADISDR